MMRSKKTILIISSLLFAGILQFLYLSDRKPANLESVQTVSSVKDEQIEIKVRTAEEEVRIDQVIHTDKPIAEEIKAKVREIVEGAFNFFKKDQKIVSIGDSLTEGVGDETESGGYVGILNHTFEANSLNISVENFGKRGNRSDQLLKRLEKEEIVASIKEADTVLITIGANDIMNVLKKNFTNLTMEPFQRERMEYIERLTAIFDKINELNPDVQIYLIGFYNPFERYFADIKEFDQIIDNWNEAGKTLSEEYENVRYIPTKDLFTNSTIDLLAEDEFHPNTNGYKLMAQRVLEYLKEPNETAVNTAVES
ncbi:SGNH/GDSL hydrolase family protein [Bacillus sp. MRMR6]|uniref:SGNH/GDSL hydrolase family protein n=1 Tax=Bacillus sp. MRMR6 TaxID=1928617 RepID=UPI000B19CF1B|nr:SGNH/GDSL hydrolase family protein [Bacillus sp. MRMR6]